MKYEYKIEYQIGTAKKNRNIHFTSFVADRKDLSFSEMRERIPRKGVHIKSAETRLVGFSIAAWAAFFIA